MDVSELKEKFTGVTFDEIQYEIDAETLAEYAKACGEIAPRFVDPSDPDFQAVPNFTTSYHGKRMLPKGFPLQMQRSFDAGKTVDVYAPIRPGDEITGKSTIADIFEKTGRSGKMLFVVHRMEFFNQRGENVSKVD